MPEQLKPICFMVMPFGAKATSAAPGTGPVKVDFDRDALAELEDRFRSHAPSRTSAAGKEP